MKHLFLLLFLACLLPALSQNRDRFSDDDSTNTNIDPDFVPQRTAPRAAPANDRFIDKLRFGGFFNAGFSNGFTFITLSPRVFYLPVEKLWLGVGGTFIYSNNSFNPPPFNEQVIWGLNFSTMYQVIKTPIGDLFAHVEYEPLNFERVVQVGFNEFAKERLWAHGVFVGGGIMQTSGRGGVFISALYNLTFIDGERSFYTSPWVFRIGVGF